MSIRQLTYIATIVEIHQMLRRALDDAVRRGLIRQGYIDQAFYLLPPPGTTASAPAGRGWFGSAGAIRRPGSSGCGTWRSSSSHAGTKNVPTGVHASVPTGVPPAVPQPDQAGNAVPQAIPSPSATSGDKWRCRPDRNSGDSGGRLVGS
jgi:hypothetical protein